MHIAAIAIYSYQGRRHIVRFNAGLSIITGFSGTGKSSLLDIAEFCLGRTHPSYPVGVLTEFVSWFALEFTHDGAVVTVARPAPGDTMAGVDRAMIQFGVSVDDLAFEELKPNTDARGIRSELSRLLGIPANQVRPGTATSGPLAATASHALLLCFQAQGEIANKAHLFHRSDEDWVEDAIRSTLPYFVGAVDIDTIALRQQLEARQRELRRAEALLVRARAREAEEVEGVSALLAEAAVLGLTNEARRRGEDALEELRRIRAVDLDSQVSQEAVPSDAIITPLDARQREITAQLAGLEHRLSVVRRAATDRAEFGNELTEQRGRLMSIGLLEEARTEGDNPVCPACGQLVEEDRGSIDELVQDLAALDAQLGAIRGSQPAVDDRRGQLEASIAELRNDLRAVTADIDAAIRGSAELGQTRDLKVRQAFLQGRILEFLGAVPAQEGAARSLEQAVETLTGEVKDLEDRLNPASFRERTDSLLRVISADVTAWARTLDLGYSEFGIQIDPNALTVVADTRQGPVELERMGSAANIMGYHVLSHLALHKWFLEQRRPVPSFLLLDQPSQVFYPDDVRKAEDELITDEDRARITSLYALIHDVVADLGDGLQVVVLDHANLDVDWFQDAVVGNWRGEALVPHLWLTEPGRSGES